MAMKTILHAAEKFVTDNSPGILTGLAVAGTVTTVLLTGKAAYSTGLQVAEKERKVDHKGNFIVIDRKEKIQLFYKEFIPAAISGVATVTCIIAANHIGTRRTAAIAAAFKLSEKLTEEYKERIVGALGVHKEEMVRSDLAADRIEKLPDRNLLVISGSEALFYDELSGRLFTSEIEKVRKAVNDINYKVNNYYAASLTEFYEMIGLKRTQFSDDFGWNTDQLLDVQFTATLYDEGKAAISIAYNSTPIRGYDRCQ